MRDRSDRRVKSNPSLIRNLSPENDRTKKINISTGSFILSVTASCRHRGLFRLIVSLNDSSIDSSLGISTEKRREDGLYGLTRII